MKKYKLIKHYPSLPTNFKEGTEVSYYSVIEGYSDHHLGGQSLVEIPYEEVENNSEFWEKVLEPKYSIVTMFDGFNRFFRTADNQFSINLLYKYREIDLLNRKDCRILSIKRLLDDKVFAEGDTVFIKNDTFKKFSIHRIFFTEQEAFAVLPGKALRVSISDLCKVDPVEFQSYDNETLTEKSNYYVVNDKFNWIQNGAAQTYPSFTNNKTKYYVFSSYIKAEEFIIQNKPCLSLKEVDDMMENTSAYRSDMLNYLKKIIKDKL